jgi:tetratricopeptide (TPR) repeat protein
MRPTLLTRIALVLSLLAALAGLPALAIDQGRVLGRVVDESGAPLAGVKVIVTSPDLRTFHLERTTDNKGQFTLIVVDANRAYAVRFEKEGYAPLEQPLPIKIEDTSKQTFTLHKAAAPAPATKLSGSAPPESTGVAAAQPAAGEATDAKKQAILTFNAGVGALNTKDFATAVADFEKAAALDPSLAPVHLALAEVYAEQKKNAEALAAIDRFVALQPGDPRGLRTRYDVLRAMADPRAAEALDRLVAADRSHETAVRVFNHAADALRSGNVDAGIKELNRALEIEPGLEPAYSGLASLYLSQRRYQDALNLADRWLQLKPGQPEPLNVRFQALVGLKDPRAKEARAAAQAAAAHPPALTPAVPPPQGPGGAPPATAPVGSAPAAPAAPAAETPESIFNRGIALYNSGKVSEAMALFEQTVAVKPEMPRAHYMLALCYTNAGQEAKAREHLQEFLRLAPNDPEAPAAREMLKYLH